MVIHTFNPNFEEAKAGRQAGISGYVVRSCLKVGGGAGEMSLWFRILLALAEELHLFLLFFSFSFSFFYFFFFCVCWGLNLGRQIHSYIPSHLVLVLGFISIVSLWVCAHVCGYL